MTLLRFATLVAVWVVAPITVVGLLWMCLPPSVKCLLIGHDWNWNRPRIVQKRRIEDCMRCFATQDHVPPRGDVTPRLSQLDLDGSVGRPVSARPVPAEELDTLRAERETRQREAEIAFQKASEAGGIESLGVN